MESYDESLNKIGEMLYGREIWDAMVKSVCDLKEENKNRAATAPQKAPLRAVSGDDEQ